FRAVRALTLPASCGALACRPIECSQAFQLWSKSQRRLVWSDISREQKTQPARKSNSSARQLRRLKPRVPSGSANQRSSAWAEITPTEAKRFSTTSSQHSAELTWGRKAD